MLRGGGNKEGRSKTGRRETGQRRIGEAELGLQGLERGLVDVIRVFQLWVGDCLTL